VGAWEILEHPADIGLRARGPTLAGLFENAAAGMMEIAASPAGIGEREQKPMVAEAPDREALLVAFLEEILWLVDGQGWLPARVAVPLCGISETAVAATAFGEPRDTSRHQMRLIIKAVTYHQLAVRQTAQGWEAEVYFDI
jgi:SHS2 domain-containing protein